MLIGLSTYVRVFLNVLQLYIVLRGPDRIGVCIDLPYQIGLDWIRDYVCVPSLGWFFLTFRISSPSIKNIPELGPEIICSAGLNWASLLATSWGRYTPCITDALRLRQPMTTIYIRAVRAGFKLMLQLLERKKHGQKLIKKFELKESVKKCCGRGYPISYLFS